MAKKTFSKRKVSLSPAQLKAQFLRLLAPRLIRRLREHNSGAAPLRSGALREIRLLLKQFMSESEVRRAVAPKRRRQQLTS